MILGHYESLSFLMLHPIITPMHIERHQFNNLNRNKKSNSILLLIFVSFIMLYKIPDLPGAKFSYFKVIILAVDCKMMVSFPCL